MRGPYTEDSGSVQERGEGEGRGTDIARAPVPMIVSVRAHSDRQSHHLRDGLEWDLLARLAIHENIVAEPSLN